MRKDAVVLEIRDKKAVVLASDGRFLQVRNEGYHVGQRIPEAEPTSIRPRSVLRRTLLIAACFVLVLGSSALAASKYMVWSYAGVDVGDLSVNYALNFRNEVLNAEGNSAEAEQLIGSLEKIPYEPVDSAVERILDATEERQPEETETPEVVISVASFMGGTEKTEERIKEGIHRSMEKVRPDEPGKKHEEEIRVERVEWQDAGQFMEDRHQPQNTQMPAGAEEDRQPPEEAMPEKQENPAPEQKTTEQQEQRGDPQDAEYSTGRPTENDTSSIQEERVPEEANGQQTQPAFENNPGQQSTNLPPENETNPMQEERVPEEANGQQTQPAFENNPGQQPANLPPENETSPMQEERIPEEANGQQTQPAFENSPGQQPANLPPENEMNEPKGPGDMQEPPGTGEEHQAQPMQPQPRPDGGIGP